MSTHVNKPGHGTTGPTFQAVTEAATSQLYRDGNRLVVYQNGDEIFPAMLSAISRAQHTVEFSTYVYWRSSIASQFADALIERAVSGVTVRLLVDAVGGAVMDSRTLWRLERAGVRVVWFRPIRLPYLHKFNNRTHRKILIIDGQIGFTGGVGIAAEWTGQTQDARHWRETHCRVDGPACIDLYAGFTENWREATGETMPEPPTPPAYPDGLAVQTVISTAGRHRPTAIDQLFAAVFARTTQRLWITTAYFVPSPAMCRLLSEAAARGVDVRVLTNGPLSNHKITRLAGRASYQGLLAAGVKLYEYQQTVLHAKAVTADGLWCTLGSANLDGRSLIHNDELNISVCDKALAAQIDDVFLQDLAQSHEILLDQWSRRPWLDRAGELSTYFVRGQL